MRREISSSLAPSHERRDEGTSPAASAAVRCSRSLHAAHSQRGGQTVTGQGLPRNQLS